MDPEGETSSYAGGYGSLGFIFLFKEDLVMPSFEAVTSRFWSDESSKSIISEISTSDCEVVYILTNSFSPVIDRRAFSETLSPPLHGDSMNLYILA